MWPKQSHGSSFPSSFLVLSTSATALMKIHTTSCRHRLSPHRHPLSRGNETIWEELGRALLKEKVTEVKEDGYWQTICKFRSGSFHTFKDRSIYLHTSYTNPTFSLFRLAREYKALMSGQAYNLGWQKLKDRKTWRNSSWSLLFTPPIIQADTWLLNIYFFILLSPEAVENAIAICSFRRKRNYSWK